MIKYAVYNGSWEYDADGFQYEELMLVGDGYEADPEFVADSLEEAMDYIRYNDLHSSVTLDDDVYVVEETWVESGEYDDDDEYIGDGIEQEYLAPLTRNDSE